MTAALAAGLVVAMALWPLDASAQTAGGAGLRATAPLGPPAATAIPAGPLGDSIRLGQQIIIDTQSTVKAYVGNGLVCANCHLDAGRTANAAPLVGLTGLFPEYRARRGRVESLEQRINDCFVRSMNGSALPSDSKQMVALLAYTAWLSQGVPTGSAVAGRGFLTINAPAAANGQRGKLVYGAKCAACHGLDGQGVKTGPATYAFPPLWGAQSFNDGAGMARVSIASGFVQAKMPFGDGGTLTDQQAVDVAAYFTAQPRPHFTAANNDWPNGAKPTDVPTQAPTTRYPAPAGAH